MLHVIVHPKTFGRRFKAVAALTPKHDHARPVLETIQLAVSEDGSAILRATNPDSFAALSVTLLKLASPGVVQLPREPTLRALKDAKAARLGIEELAPQRLALIRDPNASPGNFTLTSGQETIATLPPEDFPVFEEVVLTDSVRVTAWRLCRLIAATVYATDPACTRYALAGVALEFAEGRLSLVATDGNRLAHAYAPARGGLLTPAAHVVSNPNRSLAPAVRAEALRGLAELLAGACEENAAVQLAWTADGHLHVQAPGLRFRARQLEGRFPRWEDIVPPPSPHRAEIRDVTSFRNALTDARKRLTQDRHTVRFRLQGNRLFIETDEETDPGRTAVPVSRPDADSGEVACPFNPRLFEGWADVVGSFVVDLPETAAVTAVFRSEGLDFYLMPVPADAPVAPDIPASGCSEIEEAEEAEDTLPADEPQDGRDELRPGPPDESTFLNHTDVLSSSPTATSGATTMSVPSDQDQGNSRKAPRTRGGQPTDETQTQDGKTERPKRPARTFRMGRIRAALWRNETDNGILYNTTFERIYKVDDEQGWKSSDSFGPNDLLLLGKIADLAHTWIMRQQGAEDGY